MEKLGTHAILNIYGVEFSKLNDIEYTYSVFNEAISRCGATLVSSQHKMFEPQGLTYIGLLSESHISIHTWPEKGHACVDIFTCGEHVDTMTALQYIIEEYSPSSHWVKVVDR